MHDSLHSLSPVEEVYELEAELVVDVLLRNLRVHLRRHHESKEELVHQLAARYGAIRCDTIRYDTIRFDRLTFSSLQFSAVHGEIKKRGGKNSTRRGKRERERALNLNVLRQPGFFLVLPFSRNGVDLSRLSYIARRPCVWA